MPELSVTINGRNYAIACEAGQEEHTSRLAEYIKVRVEELVESNGQIGDARLLLMASLLVSDELSDAYAELAAAQSGEGAVGKSTAADVESYAEKVERIAERAEAIAERLERSH
tara:strand:+ start:128 stop:469 length:342 start_codon:yes stop_codon:yes gene_type:complete